MHPRFSIHRISICTALLLSLSTSAINAEVSIFDLTDPTSPEAAHATNKIDTKSPVHAELQKALQIAESKTKTPSEAQKVAIFAQNDLINQYRLNGLITETQYQAAQKIYEAKNHEIAAKAAMDAGADFEKQKSLKNRYSPGTDSDYIVKLGANNQDPVAQVKAIQSNYTKALIDYIGPHAEHLKQYGIEFDSKEDFLKKYDVDFMADPKTVTPEQMRKIAKLNNDAYKRILAAEYEALVRAKGGTKKLTPEHFKAYAAEMQDFIDKKTKLINAGKSNPKLKDDYAFQAEFMKTMAQKQKYISRIEGLVDNIIDKYDIKMNKMITKDIPYYEIKVDGNGDSVLAKIHPGSIAADAADRGPHKTDDLLKANALSAKSLADAQIQAAKAISMASTKGWPDAANSIASITKGLPMEAKVEVLEVVSQHGGKALANQTKQVMLDSMPPPRKKSFREKVGNKIDLAALKVEKGIRKLTGLNNNTSNLSSSRKFLNIKATQGLKLQGQIDTFLSVYQTQDSIRKYYELIQKALDPDIDDKEAEAYFKAAQDMAWETSKSSGKGAAIAFALTKTPTLAQLYSAWTIGYDGTSYIINDTKTGKHYLDKSVRATVMLGEKLGDLREEVLGGETKAEREERIAKSIEAKFKAALDRGDIKLAKNMTYQDAVSLIKAGQYKLFRDIQIDMRKKKKKKKVEPKEKPENKETPDSKEALEKLANNGDAEAMFKLGEYYRTKEKDFKKAEFWYNKASLQNHYAAKTQLGRMYYFGKTGERDLDKAYALISSAAKSGYELAIQYLDQFFRSNIEIVSKKVVPERGNSDTTFEVTVSYRAKAKKFLYPLQVNELGELKGPVSFDFGQKQNKSITEEDDIITKSWKVKPQIKGTYTFNFELKDRFASQKGSVGFMITDLVDLNVLSANVIPAKGQKGNKFTFALEYQAPIGSKVKETVSLVSPTSTAAIETLEKETNSSLNQIVQSGSLNIPGNYKYKYSIDCNGVVKSGSVPFSVLKELPYINLPTSTVIRLPANPRIVSTGSGLKGSTWLVTGKYRNGPRSYTIVVLNDNPGNFRVKCTGHRAGDVPALFTGTKSGSRINLTGYKNKTVSYSNGASLMSGGSGASRRSTSTMTITVNGYLSSSSSISGDFGTARSRFSMSGRKVRGGTSNTKSIPQFKNKTVVTKKKVLIPLNAKEKEKQKHAQAVISRWKKAKQSVIQVQPEEIVKDNASVKRPVNVREEKVYSQVQMEVVKEADTNDDF